MLSQNFRFITACTGEAVEPVNRLGSVLVFGAKSFDSPPFWSAEEPDCSVVRSWIQRFFNPRERIFEFYDGEFFNVCRGVSGVTCERRSSVCSVIYEFLVLRFCFGKLESIAAVSA